MSFQKHKPKGGRSHRRQVVHPLPQTPQSEPIAKPESLLLIILNLVCESEIKEAHCISTNPLFKNNVYRQKFPGEVDKCILWYTVSCILR